MARGNVRVSIDSKFDDRGVRDAERSVGRLEKTTGSAFAGVGKAALGAGAALVGAGSVVEGLTSTVRAANEAEVSQRKLETQLKALGISYRDHAREIDNVIQKTSKLAGLDDEDLQDAFTNIVRVTGDVNKSLRLTGLAADFARAKQIDVAKAGEIVGKVAGGNTGILSRYGIVLEKGASASQALGELQKRFAGQAEAYGKTTAGAMDRAGVAIENLQESIGAKLAPAVADAANAFANFINGGTEFRKTMASVRRASGLTEEEMRKLGAAFTRASQVIDNTLGRVFAAVRAIFGGMLTYLRGQVKVIAGVLTGNFGQAWQGIKDQFRGGVKAALGVLDAASKPFQRAGRKLVDSIVDGIKSAAKSIGDAIYDVIPGPAKGLFNKISHIGDGIGEAIGQGVGALFPAAPGGGGLMGARPALSPIVGIASRYGLQTSSGFRPGAITSSGNRSYHSTGEAVDEAGSPTSMMAFFRYMRKNWGPRLAELIYTPGGVGIKNGRPYTYTGLVAADHLDHVHVALDTGPPGVGDGMGKDPGIEKEQGWLQRTWQKVAPLWGLTGSTPLRNYFKHIRFNRNSPFVGVATDDGRRNPELLWPRWIWANSKGQKKLDERSKLQLFIHEMAHRFQDPKEVGAAGWLAEGGAEAFARIAMINRFGGAAPRDGDPYNGFVTRVMKSRGVDWVLRSQFHLVNGRAPDEALTAGGTIDPKKVLKGPIGQFGATSYGPPWGGINGTGVTSTGVNLKGAPHTYGIAVDPRKLSLGKSYYVWPNPFGYRGAFKAFDTGGAIKGNRIDFYDWRGRASQLDWGNRPVTVSTTPFGAGAKKNAGKSKPGVAKIVGGSGVANVPEPPELPSYTDNTPQSDVGGEDPSAAQIAELQQANATLAQLLDLQKQATDEFRQAYNVSQAQYAGFSRWLGDVVSGQVGGKVGLGFQSPSFAGGGVRY